MSERVSEWVSAEEDSGACINGFISVCACVRVCVCACVVGCWVGGGWYRGGRRALFVSFPL